ncbi:MAG TPA: hypothetical protein VN193_11145 [Candidatus Angelobacter sp.]|nr:hypothetical protein [Candidatus Angelobacter sp.]
MTQEAMTQTPTTSPPSPETHALLPAVISTRALTGFVDEETGLNLLLGPQRATASPDSIKAAQETLAQHRATVASRSSYTPTDLRVPCPDEQALTVAATRADLHSRLHPLVGWRVGYVDLTQVIAYQPFVRLDGMDARLAGAQNDLSWLMEYALPGSGSVCQVGLTLDPDGRAVTLTSANPNLRVHGMNVTPQAEVQPMPHLPTVKLAVVQVMVGFGSPFIQVAHLGDRWILRDGYHRAAGLLSRGITCCPVVITEFANWESMGIPAGMISRDVVLGDHPPLLRDFWNDGVSAQGATSDVRKLVRITASDFAIA